MDYELAEQKVTEFLAILQTSRARYEIGSGAHQYAYLDDPAFNAAETQINAKIATIERIAAHFDAGLATRIRTKSQIGWEHYAKVDAAEELVGRIRSVEEEEALFGIQGPKLAAAQMHRWVWDAAAGLWENGHRREAIQAAATAIFDFQLPAKLGVPAGQPRDLANSFSTDPPTAQQPRLRLPGYTPGDRSWTNAHDGAKFLGFACGAGIRNIATHTVTQPDEPLALEALAALSLFARWCDDAAVETI
jgi:hypothetical protein